MAIALTTLWLLLCGAILWAYRTPLWAYWHEPMLVRPVIIIESDDWGPGKEQHASRLQRLANLLLTFADRSGNPPVMTLGVILALPDSRHSNADGRYHRLVLADPRFAPIVSVMQRGESAGVFALQLHGMEHFWPQAVMKAARHNEAIRAWLNGQELPDAGNLPSPLQSRWTDASHLPSSELAHDAIADAVAEEVCAFKTTFGASPRVVVPPTFIWNEAVERAFAAAGVTTLITPGRRFTARDKQGRPAASDRPLLVNGQAGASGISYLVRDIYFEPALGHTAEQCMPAIVKNARLGRPALLETHRFNFTGDEETAERSFREMDLLLQKAVANYPELLFVSSERLAALIAERASTLIESDPRKRLFTWLQRIREIPRLPKLAWISGLVILFIVLNCISKKPSRSP